MRGVGVPVGLIAIAVAIAAHGYLVGTSSRDGVGRYSITRVVVDKGGFIFVRLDTASGDLCLFGAGGGKEPGSDRYHKCVRRVTAGIAQTIAPLIAADIDPQHRLTLAHALVGLAEGANRRLIELGDDFDPDAIASQVAELAWAGLRGVHRR